MSDVDYLLAMYRIVLPIAYEFQPELLLISAGFDAAVGDPLGLYNVSPEAFGHIVNLLKPVCGGKMVLALEGGYNCNTVGYCLSMCAKALLGDPLPPLNKLGTPSEAAVKTVRQVIKIQSRYWQNLQLQKTIFVKQLSY